MADFSGKRVVVMGLGRFGGGVGVSRFLASRGAKVLVTDQAPAEELEASITQLQGLPIAFRLGEHRHQDFTSADLVVVNPAVDQRKNQYVQAARAAGVPLTSEIRLLIDHLPQRGRKRTIGVTGTAGKSTTVAMIGHILRKQQAALKGAAVFVGGNLGGSLLGELERIKPEDWVVLELSSFMLEDMAEDNWSPHVAVLTNFNPNHLDRHGTLEAYARAKQVIFEHQEPEDHAILGAVPRGLFHPRTANLHWVEVWDNMVGIQVPVRLLIPGQHNILNAHAAIEAAVCAGIDRHDAAQALADFPGLPHRLQFVGARGLSADGSQGVRFFNDSKATTPEATELALRSFNAGCVHLILGGYDKGSDLAPLARFAAGHCRGLYTIGVTGDAIAAAAQSALVDGPKSAIYRCGTLDRAVAQALEHAVPGEVVLLSPACASWDQFDNFEQRGDAFVAAVQKFTGR